MLRRRILNLACATAATLCIGSAAAQAQSLVIYNTISTKVMQSFVEDFAKLNPGIKVEVISAGGGELLTRINAERARPRGDIFVGPDMDNFDAALDMFDGYVPKDVSGFPASAAGKDGKYFGFSTNFQVFIVNTKMLPLDKAPQSWADLTKPEFKGQVLMANPAQSGSAYSQMHQMLMLYGWDMMTKVISVVTFVPSSKLAYQNVAKGEFPVGITSEFNVVAMQAEGLPVAAIYPSDGTALIMDANGLIKGAPNPENAKKFLDYIVTKRAHDILVDVDKRRSARTDVAPPAGLKQLPEIKSFAYDSAGAAQNRKASIERFDKIFSAK